MRPFVLILSLLAPGLPTPAEAQDLLALAARTAEIVESPGRLMLASGPWRADQAPPQRAAEGALRRQAFILPDPALTTASALASLRDALAGEGLEPLYECADVACGGFDFRFALVVLPEPDMHVDLGDFRYLSAMARDGRAAEVIVSRGPGRIYLQLTRISALTAGNAAVKLPDPDAQPQTEPLQPQLQPQTQAQPLPKPQSQPAGALTATLLGEGHAVMEDLVFASGSADLQDGDYASIAELGRWLVENPDRRVALVGHTDASGGLEANIALSKRRAASVRARLLQGFEIAPERLGAEGMGYLAPRSPNDTPDQRALNRRVEVILLPAE